MGVLQRILETIFWLLLILVQAPAAAGLWLISLPMRVHKALAPGLIALLRPSSARQPPTGRKKHRRRSKRRVTKAK